MGKSISVTLPAKTLAVLDRVAPKGHRSEFIARAVLHYVKKDAKTRSKKELRDRLKREALANAGHSHGLTLISPNAIKNESSLA